MYFMKSKLGSLWNQHWLYNHFTVSLNMAYYREHSFWRILQAPFQGEQTKSFNLTHWKEGNNCWFFIFKCSAFLLGSCFIWTCLSSEDVEEVVWDKFIWIPPRWISGQLFRRLEFSNTSDYFIALSMLKFLGKICIVWSWACSLQSQRLLTFKVTHKLCVQKQSVFLGNNGVTFLNSKLLAKFL